jgi:type II secretory pathway component PulF
VLEQLADQIIAENTSSSVADQAIAQLGSQVAASEEGKVSHSIFQLAQQQAIADEGDDNDDVEQAIAQIAEQVAEGEDISQAVVQVAE